MLDWTGRYAFLNLFTTAARVSGVLCLSLLFDSVIQKGWKGMDWREVKWRANSDSLLWILKDVRKCCYWLYGMGIILSPSDSCSIVLTSSIYFEFENTLWVWGRKVITILSAINSSKQAVQVERPSTQSSDWAILQEAERADSAMRLIAVGVKSHNASFHSTAIGWRQVEVANRTIEALNL